MKTDLIRTGNKFVGLLLRSPLHGLLGSSTAVISVTGLSSGRTYATPVNYVRRGNIVRIVSFRHRTWWRNLRGGAAVRMLVAGHEVAGWATVAEDPAAAGAELAAYLGQAPGNARYFGVGVGTDGRLNAQDIAKAAETRVVIAVELGDEAVVLARR